MAEARMKLKQQVSKRALITLLISFFVVPVVQARQNQKRPETRATVKLEPIMVAPNPALAENIRKRGNELQASAIHRVLPVYPPDVKPDQLSGIAIVTVRINKAGNVDWTNALTGHPLFKKAAVEALRSWKWEPTLIKDAPQYVEGNIRFDFDGNGVVSINTSDDPEVVNPRNIYRAELLNKLEADLEALRAAPTPDLYGKAGQAYFNLGRIEEAEETYKEGISHFPREIRLYLGLAGIYGKKNQMEEMIKALEQAAQLKPEPDSPVHIREEFSGALNYLGILYLFKERYTEAKEVLEESLSINPMGKNTGTYEMLGITYAKLGDRKSAVIMYKKLLELGDKTAAMKLENEICILDVLKRKRK
jgi:TonB family protein